MSPTCRRASPASASIRDGSTASSDRRPSAAVLAFQSDSGLVVDGVCGAATAQSIRRVSSQTGTGPGIAVLRERERLHGVHGIGDCRVAVGQFGGLSSVARNLVRGCAPQVPPSSPRRARPGRQALTPTSSTPTSTSASSRRPTTTTSSTTTGSARSSRSRVAPSPNGSLPRCADSSAPVGASAQVTGLRLPVLRETRMPAVLCVLGPARTVQRSGRHRGRRRYARRSPAWLRRDPEAREPLHLEVVHNLVHLLCVTLNGD